MFYILLLSNNFWAGVMAQGLCLSFVFLSFVVVTGMGGMVSLAQATFVTTAGPHHRAAVPALPRAVLRRRRPRHPGHRGARGWSWPCPALRLGGLPLALATLALALLGDNVLFQWNWLNNNQTGWTIPRPKIGPRRSCQQPDDGHLPARRRPGS